MSFVTIALYGLVMALLGAAMISWALPSLSAEIAERRKLYNRAYEAALSSLVRWQLGVHRVERQAESFARGFVRIADESSYAYANNRLDEWIVRAEATNNLLAMPAEQALAAVKEFRDRRFPNRRSA